MSALNESVILVTHPIHDEVLQRLRSVGRVDMNIEAEPWTQDEIAWRLARADAMMAFMTDRVDASVLANAPALRVIACALKGWDSFDAVACERAGVWMTVVPDLLTQPTAELAVGLAISLARHVPPGHALVHAGGHAGWRPRFYGKALAGATVAVVGLGRLGSAIINLLQGFGCSSFLGVDPGVRLNGVQAAGLDHALRAADFVFVAAPLTPSSKHLIDSTALLNCKRGLFLINVGRGSVVAEDAVAEALRDGRLGGYAADVFEFEDWSRQDRPRRISKALLEQPNVLFTPHLGSADRETRLAIEHRAADNIIAVLRGLAPPDAVNRPARSRASGLVGLGFETDVVK
jgi:phosphonate dehydrogenase